LKNAVELGDATLLIQVLDMPPYVVGRLIGTATPATSDIVAQAGRELLVRAAESVVIDVSELSEIAAEVIAILSRWINEAQRKGRNVCLVRCSDHLFRRLQRAGMSGAVTHAGSLLAATQGLAGEPASTLDLYLRSTPALLHRLRSVTAAVAREAGLPEETELLLKTAITEAAANAIVHGSPKGPRNHVRISFHLEPRMLIVDVADQGPGFDPNGLRSPDLMELREHGYGLHIMKQSMDRVEFYRDDQGMLVRLTKFLQPGRGDWAQ
jgi:serine/threonine-protein kinase RsbW